MNSGHLVFAGLLEISHIEGLSWNCHSILTGSRLGLWLDHSKVGGGIPVTCSELLSCYLNLKCTSAWGRDLMARRSSHHGLLPKVMGIIQMLPGKTDTTPIDLLCSAVIFVLEVCHADPVAVLWWSRKYWPLVTSWIGCCSALWVNPTSRPLPGTFTFAQLLPLVDTVPACGSLDIRNGIIIFSMLVLSLICSWMSSRLQDDVKFFRIFQNHFYTKGHAGFAGPPASFHINYLHLKVAFCHLPRGLKLKLKIEKKDSCDSNWVQVWECLAVCEMQACLGCDLEQVGHYQLYRITGVIDWHNPPGPPSGGEVLMESRWAAQTRCAESSIVHIYTSLAQPWTSVSYSCVWSASLAVRDSSPITFRHRCSAPLYNTRLIFSKMCFERKRVGNGMGRS